MSPGIDAIPGSDILLHARSVVDVIYRRAHEIHQSRRLRNPRVGAVRGAIKASTPRARPSCLTSFPEYQAVPNGLRSHRVPLQTANGRHHPH